MKSDFVIIASLLIILASCGGGKEIVVGTTQDDRFTLERNIYMGKTAVDTVRDTNHIISSIGHRAIQNNGDTSSLRVGKWTEYYTNGLIKATGTYEIGPMSIAVYMANVESITVIRSVHGHITIPPAKKRLREPIV